jgi:hypothetical protein
MNIVIPETFVYSKEFVFYDVFAKSEKEIIGIGPYQPSVFDFDYKTIVCSIGKSDVTPDIVNDPHKHTLICSFKFKDSIYKNDFFTIKIQDVEKNYVIKKIEKNMKQIAIGTMFKNCAKYLDTWLIYHKSIGFTHFYLYDNNSNDTEILHDVIRKHIDYVTLISWPFPYVKKPSGISGQTTAQNNCVYKYGSNCKYIALTDLDEYIYSVNSSLKDVLARYENQRESIGGLLMPCQWFGCSKKAEYTDDYLEKLVMRKSSSEGLGKGKGPKSIVIPENTKCFAIHRIVNGKTQIPMEADLLRFNHYKTLTCNGKNYRQLYRKPINKICNCEIFDVVKDTGVADYYKNISK